MAGDLVTIASFWDAHVANMARSRLEAAGISARLDGEQTAGAIWYLANATGGVRLMVREEDAERAIAELEAVEHDHTGDEMASGAGPDEDGGGDDGADSTSTSAHGDTETDADEPDQAEPEPTQREVDSDRAVRCALFGLIFPPFLFYATWLLIKVFVSEQQIAPNKVLRASVAAVIALPMTMLWVYSLFYMYR